MSLRSLLIVLGLSLASIPASAWALTRVDSLRLIPTGQPTDPLVIYRYTFYGSTQDDGNVFHNFGQTRHRMEGRVPISEKADRSVAIAPRLKYINTRTDAQLVGSVTSSLIGTDFFDAGFGFEYVKLSPSKGTYGFLFDVGSASDRPFKPDTISFDTTLYLRPGTGKGAGPWVYFIDWSNNRMILKGFPFPGLAYSWNPSPTVNMMLGFPVLALDARPMTDWIARVRFFLGKTFTADAIYTLSPTESIRFGFDWDLDVFLKHGRADPSQRFVMMERRLGFDLLATVLPKFQVRVGGGYVAGREIFEGGSLLSTPETQVKLQPTVYGSIAGALEL